MALSAPPLQFNASGFGRDDFLYFMADAAAETVQYGYQATLCKYLDSGTGTPMQVGTRFLLFLCEQLTWNRTALRAVRDGLLQSRLSGNTSGAVQQRA